MLPSQALLEKFCEKDKGLGHNSRTLSKIHPMLYIPDCKYQWCF